MPYTPPCTQCSPCPVPPVCPVPPSPTPPHGPGHCSSHSSLSPLLQYAFLVPGHLSKKLFPSRLPLWVRGICQSIFARDYSPWTHCKVVKPPLVRWKHWLPGWAVQTGRPVLCGFKASLRLRGQGSGVQGPSMGQERAQNTRAPRLRKAPESAHAPTQG